MPPPSARVLIQLSDTHLLPGGAPLHGRVDTLARLRRALAAVEASGPRPDALVFSGDLADTGDPAAYRLLRETVEPVAARLGSTLAYAMGNHDDRAAFRAALLDDDAATASDDPATPCDHVVRVGGLRLVVLDSSEPGRVHGTLTGAQLAWLRDELATPAPEGTVVVMHHPPLGAPTPGHHLMLLRDPDRFAAVLAGGDVRVVLTGHNHAAAAGTLAGVPVWTSGAVAYTLDPLAPAGIMRGVRGGSFTRVDLGPAGVVTTLVPLDHDPEVVTELPVSELERYAAAPGDAVGGDAGDAGGAGER